LTVTRIDLHRNSRAIDRRALMAASKTKATIDQRIAKVLTHPVRVQILAILDQRVASPNEIANEIDVGVSHVAYHVKVLKDLECIELVETQPRRGAVEHFYRAIMRPYFSDRDWARLPRSARQGISSAVIQMIVDDAVESLDAGVFDAREDRHLSRLPLVLDEKGWRELNELLAETLERALDLQAQAASRMAKEHTEGVTSKLSILHFESPV
jgi:DNA-binding transcriptional ArsR family regulator